MPEFNIKTILSLLLRLTLGLLFIVSFISKINDLEPIELAIVDAGISNWALAPFFSRFILSVELALGIAFLFNFVRKWTLIGSLSLLGVFSVYLLFTYFKYGNEGDCGCFGAFLELNPLESLAKNIVMIGLILLWYFYSKEEWKWNAKILITIFAVISLGIPYILNYPFYANQEFENLKAVNYPLDTELLGPLTFSDSTKPDLKKGEYIIGFLSLKCPHCMNAAYKLTILQKQYKLPPIYSVFIGKEERLQKFMEESRSSFPYVLYTDKRLMRITGPEYPIIFYVKDGTVIKKWNYLTLNEEAMKEFFQK